MISDTATAMSLHTYIDKLRSFGASEKTLSNIMAGYVFLQAHDDAAALCTDPEEITAGAIMALINAYSLNIDALILARSDASFIVPCQPARDMLNIMAGRAPDDNGDAPIE